MSSIYINDLFEKVVNQSQPVKNMFQMEFENATVKDIFEFLLEFTTMLCKYFYSNSTGKVDLSTLSENNLATINQYLECLGFKCIFTTLPATAHNINHIFCYKWDKITITDTTPLCDLLFGLKCGELLHIIRFDII